MTQRTLAVIGAGAWGTALAHTAAGSGHRVRLWCYEAEVAAEIAAAGRNDRYLPGIRLASGLGPTTDLAEAVANADAVVLAPPSHALRRVVQRMAPHLPRGVPVLSATKGIEAPSLALMSDVLAEALPPAGNHPIAALSGPSFAAEVARHVPTAVTVACRDPRIGRAWQDLLTTPTFKLFTTHDLIGVQIGGALKNVIALAAGGADGLGFGANTRAALITRGLAEMTRLGVAMGGQPWTFAGLSGLGDLVLTCTDAQSRNYTVGVRIGRGETLDRIMAEASFVAEGVTTARAARAASRKYRVLMPIVEQVHAVLYEDKDPRKAVEDLMEPAVGDEQAKLEWPSPGGGPESVGSR